MRIEFQQRIVDTIERLPGKRTLELCDLLDVDIDELERDIDVLLALGKIRKAEVKAPNGRTAIAFWSVGVAPAPADAAAPTPASVSTPSVPDADAPKMTKVDKSIGFLLANGGSASGSQLHMVMGLKPNEVPSQYLASAVANGRLVRDGKTWSIGPAAKSPKPPAPEPIKPAPKKVVLQPSKAGAASVEQASFDIPAFLREPDVETIHRLTAAALVPTSYPPIASQQASHQLFECAIWSGGEIDLRRGAQTVARLTAAESAILIKYIEARARASAP